MNKLMTLTGWLVMAAALTISFTACSSDDNLAETPVQPTATNSSKVHVTVGAGIGDGTTRSAVVNDNGSRKLTFTTGDRLYVITHITGTAWSGDDSRYVAGYLDIEGTPAAGATTATFSGDLDVYKEYQGEMSVSTYSFASNDPISECESYENRPMAILVHRDNGGLFHVSEMRKVGGYENNRIAASVDALMTKGLEVTGNYDDENQCFNLAVQTDGVQPIFNCNISGLKANATYRVIYLMGGDVNSLTENGSPGTWTADGNGNATFAFINPVPDNNFYHAIRFINTDDATEWKRVNLGEKTLASKVYNITRSAIVDPDQPLAPTITGISLSTSSQNELEYEVWKPNQDVAFTISGNSRGYLFEFSNYISCVVTLSSLTASYSSMMETFIYGYCNNDLTICLSGDNTISCPSSEYCIDYGKWYGNVKLSGKGTLTLTSRDFQDVGGIQAKNFNSNDSHNLSDLAATGYTVTRSDKTDNGDGTYTWTYTVVPATN